MKVETWLKQSVEVRTFLSRRLSDRGWSDAEGNAVNDRKRSEKGTKEVGVPKWTVQ